MSMKKVRDLFAHSVEQLALGLDARLGDGGDRAVWLWFHRDGTLRLRDRRSSRDCVAVWRSVHSVASSRGETIAPRGI